MDNILEDKELSKAPSQAKSAVLELLKLIDDKDIKILEKEDEISKLILQISSLQAQNEQKDLELKKLYNAQSLSEKEFIEIYNIANKAIENSK